MSSCWTCGRGSRYGEHCRVYLDMHISQETAYCYEFHGREKAGMETNWKWSGSILHGGPADSAECLAANTTGRGYSCDEIPWAVRADTGCGTGWDSRE